MVLMLTLTLVDEWKYDDLVQRGLRELGGAGKHPVLHQLHPEAARVPHLRGHLSRPGRRRPQEGPIGSVSIVSETLLCRLGNFVKVRSSAQHAAPNTELDF